MKVGKREKGKIYVYRRSLWLEIYSGRRPTMLNYLCYKTFSRLTNIKLKPGEMIEIEVRAIGGVG